RGEAISCRRNSIRPRLLRRLWFLAMTPCRNPMRRAIAVYRRGHWPEDTAAGSVTLAYLDRHRRRIRLVADSGEAFLLDLARAYHLGDGDGLELDSGGYLCGPGAPGPGFAVEAAHRAPPLRPPRPPRNRP